MDRVAVQASSPGEAAGYAPTWTGHWLTGLPASERQQAVLNNQAEP